MEDRVVDSEDEGPPALVLDFERLNGLIEDLPRDQKEQVLFKARKFRESSRTLERNSASVDILQTIQNESRASDMDDDDEEDFGIITFNPDGTVRSKNALHQFTEERNRTKSSSSKKRITSRDDLEATVILPENQPHVNTSSTEMLPHTHDEDDSELRKFITANEGYFRRGLRKRKFSSTHPYLADQAHWLGLMSAYQLNQLYDESQDMELVVKVLNQRYMQKRKNYPKDEKYKSKNFYAFIGKKQESSKHSLEKNKIEEESNTQNFYPEGYSDSEEDIFHPSISRKNTSLLGLSDEESVNDRREEPILQSPESQNFNDDEGMLYDSDGLQSDSDLSPSEFVSVGGRIRKEKSILKGALPESFRKLAAFKLRPSVRKNEPKEIEYRKGLAVKKHTSSTKYTKLDLLNFVDDEVHYREGGGDHKDLAQYWGVDDVFSAKGPATSSNAKFEMHKIEQISSFRSPLPYLTVDSESSLEELGFQNTNHSSAEDSVIEEDFIDPMLTHPHGHDSRKPTGTPRSKVLRSGGESNRKPTKATMRSYSRASFTSGTKGHRSKRGHSSYQKRPLKPLYAGPGNIKRRKFSISRGNPTTTRFQNFPSSPLTMDDKENQIEESHPAYRKQKSIRELLGNDYHFQREPARISTDLEMESRYPSLATPVSFNVIPSISSMIKAKSDFFDVDIKKIHVLDEGFQSFFNSRDSVVFIMLGKRYAFVLFDKMESAKTSDRFFMHLRKILRDEGLSKVLDEVYNSICHVIEWFLILQERPGDSTTRYLAAILQELLSEEATSLVPPLLLLQLIFDKQEARWRLNLSQKTFTEGCKRFWKLFFDNINANSLSNAIKMRSSLFESVHLAVLLQSTRAEPHGFWQLVDCAVRECENVTFETLTLFAATFSSGTPFWHPFFEVYAREKSEESESHIQFLGTILYLQKRHQWPIEERVITEIYLTFVKRRFANFVDEKGSPQLLGKIRTGNEFGNTFFIDRFMRLLYDFIFGLPTGANKKRLISKLISSSQYHYETGNTHYAMFVNRVNLLLLLAQVSQAEVTDNFLSLVKLVEASQDIRIYEIVVSSLRTFSDICLSRLKAPLVESFLMIIRIVSGFYMSVPGIQRLSKSLLGITENIFIQSASVGSMMAYLDIFMELDLKLMPDEMVLRVSNFLSRCIRCFCKRMPTFTSKHLATLGALNDKLAVSLNTQMGRVQSQGLKSTLDVLIEEQIVSWLGCTSIVENSWNRLLLQQYPYLGNSYLRGRYLLLLYTELLNYDGIADHKDSIIVAILRELAKPSPSVYTAGLYSQLQKKTTVFSAKKVFVPENILASQLEFFHRQIVLNAIYSIAHDSVTSLAARTLYIEELTASLDVLYTSNYSNTEVVAFCKQLLETIQKTCYILIRNSDVFWSLCSKLGVVKTARRFNFHQLNLKEQLSVLHDELLSALQFEKDYLVILDAYIEIESMHLAYDLMNIYLRAVISEQSDKWVLLACLVDFVWTRISKLAINYADIGYRGFLQMLPYIAITFCSEGQGTFKSHMTKAVVTAATILKRSVLIFDGYRDREMVLQAISAYLQPFEGHTMTKDPPNTTGLILFDIQLSKNMRFVPKDDSTAEDVGPVLASLKASQSQNETRCIEFDL